VSLAAIGLGLVEVRVAARGDGDSSESRLKVDRHRQPMRLL